jgi:hypothetical protein
MMPTTIANALIRVWTKISTVISSPLGYRLCAEGQLCVGNTVCLSGAKVPSSHHNVLDFLISTLRQHLALSHLFVHSRTSSTSDANPKPEPVGSLLVPAQIAMLSHGVQFANLPSKPGIGPLGIAQIADRQPSVLPLAFLSTVLPTDIGLVGA